jgi:opacity protein-like surface antigen
VEGGAVYSRTSITASDQGISFTLDSDRGLGFEAGAGLVFAVAPKISITPGVRFRSHDAKFSDPTDDTNTQTTTVSYVAVDLGVHIAL